MANLQSICRVLLFLCAVQLFFALSSTIPQKYEQPPCFLRPEETAPVFFASGGYVSWIQPRFLFGAGHRGLRIT